MELKKIDIIIIVLLYNKEFQEISARDISIELSLDQAIIYNSLKTLNKYKMVLSNNDRPKKYLLNKSKFKKWIKN